MGFWTKLGGAAMAIGGVAAAIPTGGASLALVPAGMGMIANDVKKEGAQKAAGQQEAAANKAIATQQQAAKATTQAYQPYTQTGGAAMSALGSFMGLPASFGASSGGMPAPVGMSAGGIPSDDLQVGSLPAATQQGLGVRTPGTPAQQPTGTAVPRNQSGTPHTQAAQSNASGYNTLGGMAGGGMVQMRAPTGQASWVPREQAPFYAAKGAQIIGFNGQPVGGVL